MTNYEKLVEALRILQDKNSLSYYKRQVCKDAADAIEKLVTLYEKAEMDATNLTGKLAQAEAQLPKWGEIVRCGECKYHMAETERTNPYCNKYHCMRTDDWFCADGEREVQDG